MAIKTNFVNQNGNTYYRITKVIGHDLNNKPIQKQFYGKSKSEAELKANEFMSKLNKGISYTNKPIAQIMRDWLFNIKKYDNIKPSTFESYESIFRLYIQNNEIGYLSLDNIKTLSLQTYYIKMSRNGISSNIIHKIHKLLHQFFKFCIVEGYIYINPCTSAKIPKDKTIQTKELEYYTENEIKIIKNKIQNYEIKNIVLFALGTGLREGELLALRYNDIDFKSSLLTVNRTVKTVAIFDNGIKKYQTIFLEPKSKNSKRTVDIPSNVLKLIPNKKSNELVFSDNGEIYSAHKLAKQWKAFLIKNKLPVKKFHSLRHTYATLLLSKGVELLTVSKLLGHSSIKITEIYSHIIPKMKSDAVNKINDIFEIT